MEPVNLQNQKNDQMKPLFETMEQQNKPENLLLEHNTMFFLTTALVYGICFAIAFYKNYDSFNGRSYMEYPKERISTIPVWSGSSSRILSGVVLQSF